MDVLASRIILRPQVPAVTQRFYRDDLGLAVAREFGSPDAPGMVFFAGPTLIEISGRLDDPARAGTAIWLQVRDVQAEVDRLAGRGVPIVRPPRQEFWGLIEAWIADPDGTPIVLVQVPADHPLRRDTRTLAP
ncbi:VOC family protein [Nakamurella sp.]|uniref:VOC family protein n=1 Tax=Nakamurella sp. TaxID=1869182 RepID=UPI003783507B